MMFLRNRAKQCLFLLLIMAVIADNGDLATIQASYCASLPRSPTTRIMRVARLLRVTKRDMPRTTSAKQNVTISISPETVQKARILAARRSTSISGLLAEEIEKLVGAEEAWERSERSALALLEQGFHLGGLILPGRDELHER